MEKLIFTISGKRSDPNNRIWVDNKEIIPEKSLKLRYHSVWFDWGANGNSQAQTALAICLEIFPTQKMAESLYIPFRKYFISNWVEDEFKETIDITDFLIDYRHLINSC